MEIFLGEASMILYLFGFYFNPLTITTIDQLQSTVRIWFGNEECLLVEHAKVYDVTSMINEAVKEFNK